MAYDSLNRKRFENHKFIDCRFGRMYQCTFINCEFVNCSMKINATYCKFLKCQFINCTYGESSRLKKALAYKTNFDNSVFDKISGLKLKYCSINGCVINYIENSTLVKCSDRYVIINGTGNNCIKINHKDMATKVVRMSTNASKGDSRIINQGKTDNKGLRKS